MKLLDKKPKNTEEEAAEHYMRARLWLLSGMAKRKVYEALEKTVFLDERYRQIIRADVLFRPLFEEPVLKRILED